MSNLTNNTSAASVASLPLSQLTNSKQATKIMLGIAVFILLCAGAAFYLVNGQIQSIEKVEQDRESQVGSSVQVARRYDATLALYDATSNQLRFLEKPVAQNAFVATLLPQMQKLAQSNGCDVRSITPSALQPDPGDAAPASGSTHAVAAPPAYQIMPLSVSITGSYVNVMQFVYSLTRFPKIVTLKSLSLHPGAAPSAPGAARVQAPVSAELQLMAYLFPALPQSPDASANPPSRLGVLNTPSKSTGDPVTQAIKTPVAAALAVQSASQRRLQDAGMPAQPTPPTMPTNPSLEKK